MLYELKYLARDLANIQGCLRALSKNVDQLSSWITEIEQKANRLFKEWVNSERTTAKKSVEGKVEHGDKELVEDR